LDYSSATFLLFITYFFIYTPPKSNWGFQTIRNSGGLKTVRNSGGLKTTGNSGGFQTIENSESFKIAENSRSFKNRWKVIIFQGFVETVGNHLVTLDLPRDKQIAGNALNGKRQI